MICLHGPRTPERSVRTGPFQRENYGRHLQGSKQIWQSFEFRDRYVAFLHLHGCVIHAENKAFRAILIQRGKP